VRRERMNGPEAARGTGATARLWQFVRRTAVPFGDLCCALFFERSLIEPLTTAPNRLNATIRLAREDDLGAICRLYAYDPWLWLGSDPGDQTAVQLYRDRLRRGERCYLACVGSDLAHVNWTCYHWGDALPGHPLRLRPGEVYTTDAFTPPAFRGRGVHALVLGAMLTDARAQGARHAYTLGQLDRPDAHKGLRALGWRETGRVVYFQRQGRPKALFLFRSGNIAPLFRR
jgi:GNAT superfamily N-acetyltransferase